MQLQFTRDELKVLAEILEEQTDIATGSLKAASYKLLDRVIAHDLGLAFDELEDLGEIVRSYRKLLRQQMAQASAQTHASLAQRERLLEIITDKVTEACAMV